MRLFSTLFSPVIVLIVVFSGCDVLTVIPSPGDGQVGTVSLANDIQPIFTARCAGCHRDGSTTSNSGIAVRLVEGQSRSTLVNQASVLDPSLTQVIPGDSTNSLLFQKVASDAPPVGLRMPRNSSALEQGQIDLIATWIDEGALDN